MSIIDDFIFWFRKQYGDDRVVIDGKVARDVQTRFSFIPKDNPYYVIVNLSIGWDEHTNCESHYVLYVVERREPIFYVRNFQYERSRGWIGKDIKFVDSLNYAESYTLILRSFEDPPRDENYQFTSLGTIITSELIYLKNVEAEQYVFDQLNRYIYPKELCTLLSRYIFENGLGVDSKAIENLELPILI